MKRLFCLIISAVMLFCLVSCGSSDVSKSSVRIAMNSCPVNLDPQLAETAEELAVVRNCFEGLFRFDNGKVKKAVCSDYSVSSDNLTWSFSLRTDAMWSDGQKVVADDFVFAIKRALNPDTIAPFASLLGCIKGGEAALSGEASPENASVYAKDGKVIIKLARPESNLPEILTKAMCMPCREDVFEAAGGRYGMSSQLIVCNGPYAITSISKSLQITKNEHYKGDFTPLFGKVVFTFGNTDTERIESLSNSITVLSSISGSSIDEANQAGLDVTQFNDTAWMVVINPSASVVGDSKVSAALKSAVDSSSYIDALPLGFECYGGVVAPDLLIGGQPYDSLIKAREPLKGNKGARQALIDALKVHSGKMPTLTLIYPEGKELKQTAARLAQYWQQQLGVVINIEAVDENLLNSQVKSGSYQLALMGISADDGNAYSALNTFLTVEGSKIGFAVTGVHASSAASVGEWTADKIAKTEKLVLNDPHIIPVAISGHYYAYNSGAESIVLDMLQGGIKLYK